MAGGMGTMIKTKSYKRNNGELFCSSLHSLNWYKIINKKMYNISVGGVDGIWGRR